MVARTDAPGGGHTPESATARVARSILDPETAQKMRALVKEALGRYGEPAVSLGELRDLMDRKLPGISLSELIVKEREASR